MRRVDVDFAEPSRLPRALGLVFALLCAIGAAHQVWQGWDLRGAHRRAAEDLERREAQARVKQAAEAPSSADPSKPYLGDAESLLKMAGRDVDAALRSLENVRVEGVKAVAIEIDAGEGVARIDLEFGGSTDLAEFLEQLNAGLEPRKRWVLTRMQAATASSPGSASLRAAVSEWSRCEVGCDAIGKAESARNAAPDKRVR